MPSANPILIDVRMPIRTPRLLIRPKQFGDGAATAAAVAETWDSLHEWMRWAENLEFFTPENMEIRVRHVMASFLLRESFELIGIEIASGEPVVWCGLHDIDWQAGQCDTGFWVRKSAQSRGLATEACNALVRYAFGVLDMRRVGLTHSSANEASRRITEKLGFTLEGVQRSAALLPGGRFADRLLYARIDTDGLPPLEVTWARPTNGGS
jgi:RimJ/RimL family protein N-acetyltransferase